MSAYEPSDPKHETYHERYADIADHYRKQDKEDPCPQGDPTCPCPDGDMCHYQGPDAWEKT